MSCFGELRIDNSRAGSDDEDDELAISKEEELISKRSLFYFDNFKNANSGQLNVDQLILAHDSVSTAFVYTYLLNHYNTKQVVGVIATQTQFNIEQKNLSEQQYQLQKSAFHQSNYVYLVQNNSKSYLVVTCYNEIKSNEIHDITQELLSKVKFQSSLILCSQHVANFAGQYNQLPFVQYITNNEQFYQINSCKRLEQPNFLTGLAAAIMNISIALKLPSITFVCYKSGIEIDIASVKQFYNAIGKSNINIFVDNQLTKESLMLLSKMISSISSLYL